VDLGTILIEEDKGEGEKDSSEEELKSSFGVKCFKTKMDDESILSVLIEFLGQWDTRDPAKHILKNDIWDRCVLYAWSSARVIFIIGDMEGNRNLIWYSANGFLTKRRIQRIIKIIAGEDWIYYSRKILWSHTDLDKIKKYDSRAYLPIAAAGVLSASFTVLSFVSRYYLWTFVAAFTTISSLTIWGLYKYGSSEDAIDLRILALAFQYTMVLQILPCVVMISALGLFLPLDTISSSNYPILMQVVYILLMILETVLLTLFFSILTSALIERRLLIVWSYVRKKPEEAIDSTLESYPSFPVNLRELAIMQWPIAQSASVFVPHIFLVTIIGYRLLITNPLYWGFIIIFSVFTGLILLTAAQIRALEKIERILGGYVFIFGKGNEFSIWGIKKSADTVGSE
jgi:hypothetical protein